MSNVLEVTDWIKDFELTATYQEKPDTYKFDLLEAAVVLYDHAPAFLSIEEPRVLDAIDQSVKDRAEDIRKFYTKQWFWTSLKLLGNRHWAAARGELAGPVVDLRRNLLALFDRCQGLLQDLGWRFLETALAGAAKVVRCLVQRDQGASLLRWRGRLARIEILARQIGKAELVLAGELPGQVQIDLAGQLGAGAQQLGRGGLVKAHQRLRGLDLDPLARVEFDLHRRFGLGQDPTSEKLARVFKQYVQIGTLERGGSVVVGAGSLSNERGRFVYTSV